MSFLWLSADFFQNLFFFQKILSPTLSVSNGLDPDQDRHSVRTDLSPNCLQIQQQMEHSAILLTCIKR